MSFGRRPPTTIWQQGFARGKSLFPLVSISRFADDRLRIVGNGDIDDSHWAGDDTLIMGAQQFRTLPPVR
jgi:hypothetical protein